MCHLYKYTLVVVNTWYIFGISRIFLVFLTGFLQIGSGCSEVITLHVSLHVYTDFIRSILFSSTATSPKPIWTKTFSHNSILDEIPSGRIPLGRCNFSSNLFSRKRLSRMPIWTKTIKTNFIPLKKCIAVTVFVFFYFYMFVLVHSLGFSVKCEL